METFDFASEWAEFERKYPKGGNLPLEDHAVYLSDFMHLMQRHAWYNPLCREEMRLAREGERELREAFLYRLDSFPMDEVSSRKLLKLLFSSHFSYIYHVDTMLQEQAESIYALESEVEALKK